MIETKSFISCATVKYQLKWISYVISVSGWNLEQNNTSLLLSAGCRNRLARFDGVSVVLPTAGVGQIQNLGLRGADLKMKGPWRAYLLYPHPTENCCQILKNIQGGGTD